MRKVYPVYSLSNPVISKRRAILFVHDEGFTLTHLAWISRRLFRFTLSAFSLPVKF